MRAGPRLTFANCVLAALVLAVCAGPSSVLGDAVTPGHPPARRFSTADGLPHDTVYAVARDAQGYLWIGTQNGAARYDGRRFVTIDMPDATSSNYVRDLLAARDGSLWFARQNGGLVRMKSGSAQVFGAAQGLATGRVNTVTEAPGPGGSLTVYAGLHAGGVYRLDGERFVPVPSEGSPAWRVWKLLVAPRPGNETRTLLAASDEGLFALENDRFVRVPVPLTGENVKPSFNSLVATEENGATSLFLGSYGTGVFRWTGSRVDRFDVARGLSSNLVTSLAATRRGERSIVWVGTRGGGLARIDGDTARAVGLDPKASEVFGLATGLGDGTVWVAVRAYGLVRLAETPFSTLDTWSGLPSDNVSDLRVVPRAEGPSVYIATNRGLGIYRKGVVTVLDKSNGLPASEIGFLALTGNPERPDAWVATLTNGFVRFREGAPTLLLDTAHGFVTDRVFALLATPEGLWVGTDLGKIVLVDPETGKTLAEVQGLPRNEVLNLARTKDGTLWAATRSGLAVIRDRTVVKVLTREDGLPNDEVLVLALVPGASGEELWAGTRGGVARLPLAGGALRFEKVPGLPAGVENAATQVILPDGRGNVYLGTHRGIVRLSGGGGARVFTTADGIPSTIANWGGLVDAAGRVWISTSGGVAILDPELEGRETRPPAPLVIQSILRNDRPVPVSDALTLRHDESVSLELALLSFSGGPLTYRAQIVGLDATASLAGASPVFRYSRLPAGDYVFRG
ncbi:MAG: hypothetical protein JNK60_15870, partial [Acidobacteria bacterium]|nr:hypothetical protein [Acidobacteriota bacterium]